MNQNNEHALFSWQAGIIIVAFTEAAFIAGLVIGLGW
jgi:F0F1-type ATP synthase membrane subunit c/vacuolar-type H+-ATPase subunit K